jgi:hypothetical protein
MKQTSITKLSEVYNNLNALYNGEQIPHDYKSLADLIQQVIRAESTTEAKAGKFDYFKYVEKSNSIRPIMQCVFHDEGFKVASDAHILIAIKDNYTEEYEQKMLHSDGSFEENGTYPKWRSVIPKPDGYEPYKVDRKAFYDWLTQKRAEYKAETGKGKRFVNEWRYQIGPAQFQAERFDLLLTAMERIGTDVLMVKNANRSAYAQTEEGTALLMPVMA